MLCAVRSKEVRRNHAYASTFSRFNLAFICLELNLSLSEGCLANSCLTRGLHRVSNIYIKQKYSEGGKINTKGLQIIKEAGK